MNISRHIGTLVANRRHRQEGFSRYLTLFGAGLLAMTAACGDTDSPQAPGGESVTELAVTPGPLPGRIAFSSIRNGVGHDIYVMNADGSGVIRLTTSRGVAPAWSYDNKKIAYMADRPVGPNKVVVDIFVIDANGANGHWASPTPSPVNLIHPTWSPDGSRILVWAQPNNLMSLDVATGALTPLKLGGQDVKGRFPSFDPTGQKIVFSAGSSLAVMNADGTGTLSTIPGPSGATVEHPRFSPDGQKILFTAATSRHTALYVASQGTLTLLADHGVGHRASWAPDGKHIAFESKGKIYQMNADGTRRTRLSAPEVLDEEPAYTH
jgi:Tol biopolymer transport system component